MVENLNSKQKTNFYFNSQFHFNILVVEELYDFHNEEITDVEV